MDSKILYCSVLDDQWPPQIGIIIIAANKQLNKTSAIVITSESDQSDSNKPMCRNALKFLTCDD